MKKIFTLGVFLVFLLGIGSNVSAATFTSRLSGISDVPTARGYRIGAWNAKSTWYDPTIVDTTTVSLPTYTDDVVVSEGDSIYLGATSYAQNLSVSGTLCMYNGGMYVNGDLTVNSAGIFSIKSNAYVKNIYNYGKIWAYNTNYNSAKILCVGYTNSGTSGTTVASTDDITILNDGVIGGQRADAAAGRNGCGFWIEYSNQAKSLTIKHSDNVTSGYTFNAGGIFPAWSPSGVATSTAATQDFNLYIKESVALFVSASPGIFSLQNGDTFTGYNRNCTIDAGDTVYVANSFHTRGSAPSASQGAMTYDVYGCIDLATYNRSKNEFDLYASANSSSVTANVKNGGSIIFGKTIGIVQSATGQTTALNAETGSTVKFGYTLAAPTITTTVNAVVTPSLFPASYYNLGFATSSYNTTLPAGLNYTVSNELSLTSGKVVLGTSNLAPASIVGGSATSYIVADGTGVLTQTASTSGTLFPIGTATGYAPVTVTPASDDIISANVSATASGTFAGYSINANEWTLTPQTATTATLAFTPTAADNTTSPAVFSGVGYADKTDATLSGSTYTVSGVSLAAAATPFATGGTTVATGIVSSATNNLTIYGANKSLVIRNAKAGDNVSVYGLTGSKVMSSVLDADNTTIAVMPGTYIVKVGSEIQKVIVQ